MAAVAFADEIPAAPTSSYAGCINGNVCVWISKDGANTNHWFQMRSLEAPDAEWATVNFSTTTFRVDSSYYKNNLVYVMPANFHGAASFRVASTNAAGEFASWLEVGPVTNRTRHTMTERFLGANGYVNAYLDGVAGSMRETGYKQSGTTNAYLGLQSASPVRVSMIRFVPRQDSTGQARLNKAVFQCADDADFTTNLRVLSDPLPNNVPLGRVHEIPIDPPVSARYFRLLRVVKESDQYDMLSIDDFELVNADLPSPIAISVSNPDWTNMWPAVTWSVPAADMCNTGVLERALSAAGPFTAMSDWTDATAGEMIVDRTGALGVTYYYRVRAMCVGGARRREVVSDIVPYTRSRRLDRSWDNLTTLSAGVSRMSPFKWIGNSSGSTANAFDGSTNTHVETTCYTNAPGEAASNANRVFNPAIGLNLGAEYHICGALVFPRSTTVSATLDRARAMAICGADEEAFSSFSQLSPKLGGFPTADWQFTMTTNTVDKFRYVFLYSPTQAQTYGNVAEVGFYGFSDQDIVDSGLLIPPTKVSCETNRSAVVVSWDRGWNNAAYRLDRRLAGGDAWIAVATVGTDVFSCADATVPSSGVWEWRVTVVSAGGDEMSSVSCSTYFKPNRGFQFIVR